MVRPYRVKLLVGVPIFCFFWVLAATSFAGNDVLGEIELVGATKVERTSGVWIDGQYIGYLKELKAITLNQLRNVPPCPLLNWWRG
jgi:hypothetical protein